MESEPRDDRSGQFRRIPRLNSGVTCGVCTGYGGPSGREYLAQWLVFTPALDKAFCPNCGLTYRWSAFTVRLRSVTFG